MHVEIHLNKCTIALASTVWSQDKCDSQVRINMKYFYTVERGFVFGCGVHDIFCHLYWLFLLLFGKCLSGQRKWMISDIHQKFPNYSIILMLRKYSAQEPADCCIWRPSIRLSICHNLSQNSLQTAAEAHKSLALCLLPLSWIMCVISLLIWNNASFWIVYFYLWIGTNHTVLPSVTSRRCHCQHISPVYINVQHRSLKYILKG